MGASQRTPGSPLRIFISHKMPSDTAVAAEIGDKLALYAGPLVEVKHAGMFRNGENWRKIIQQYLSDADWLIFLYTNEDEDWSFCLFECGFFRAKMDADASKRLITFARHPEQISDALKEFNAAAMTDEGMYKLLDEIYRKDPWNISPNLKDESLRTTATSIVAAFMGTEKVEANFDVAPSVAIEVANNETARHDLRNGIMPAGTLISGIEDWQKLFDREIDTGAWLWADLTEEWAHKSVYEFLLSRMMHDALEKRIPKGTMLRSRDSNEVHRLTLRRYEKLASNKYRFHFTASLLDLPFSLSIRRATERQTILYHLVSLSWYFRRRVVDELYRRVLELRSASTQRPVNVRSLFDEIACELMDIDAQSIIRGVDNRLVVSEALGTDPAIATMLDKLTNWYTLRADMFNKMASGASALNEVASTLSLMASINFEFYKVAATSFALAASELERPKIVDPDVQSHG